MIPSQNLAGDHLRLSQQILLAAGAYNDTPACLRCNLKGVTCKAGMRCYNNKNNDNSKLHAMMTIITVIFIVIIIIITLSSSTAVEV